MEQAFIAWNLPLFRFIRSRIQNRELAEDLTQEVFIRAWRYRDSFDVKKSSLKNWLFVIAVNLLRDYYRKNKLQIEELNEDISHEINIEKDAEQNNLIRYVFRKMTELSERDQELLLLRYKLDLKMEDIAEIMKMELSAVKVAIHRAIKKLKSICNDESH